MTPVSAKDPSKTGSSSEAAAVASLSPQLDCHLSKKKVTVMEDGKFTIEATDVEVRPGEGIPRRHPLHPQTGLITTYDESVGTLWDSFVHSVQKNGDRPYLGSRERLEDGTFGDYQWSTYQEIYERVLHLSATLSQKGFAKNSSVGLYSINREEWLIAEQACFALGLITVPLYDTLGDEAIEYICNHTEMVAVFASGDKLAKLLKIHTEIPTLQTIISFDSLSEEQKAAAEKENLKLEYFKELMAAGEGVEFTPNPPLPTDLCTICYTSGTTGLPKGVMLPHSALLADASAVMALTGVGFDGKFANTRSILEIRPDDVHISYLPLAHIFERIVIIAITAIGASVGFYQGDTLKLMEDIAVLRPTVFVSVPRLFNRVYDKVRAGVKAKGGLSEYLFNLAYETKVENLREKGQLTHWLWDRLVFASIRSRLGGRVRGMISGSAPIAPEVMEFLRVCFGCEVYEGYGSTETSAGSCLTVRYDWTTGHVGIPAPCNEVKLVDVPEMSYTSNDKPNPRGEICIRGPNCFTGYYKDEEKTREALDAEGWVFTGDIGEWDERGRLRVIDRKKNLFKLAQGEYIAPEKVESVLCKSRFIAQAFLHGDSLKASTVAIIVPDKEVLLNWARDQEGLENATLPDLCRNESVEALIMQEITKFGKKGSNELKGFEIPRAVYLESEPFSIENEILTATFKLKRNVAAKKYREIIDDLYKKIGE